MSGYQSVQLEDDGLLTAGAERSTWFTRHGKKTVVALGVTCAALLVAVIALGANANASTLSADMEAQSTLSADMEAWVFNLAADAELVASKTYTLQVTAANSGNFLIHEIGFFDSKSARAWVGYTGLKSVVASDGSDATKIFDGKQYSKYTAAVGTKITFTFGTQKAFSGAQFVFGENAATQPTSWTWTAGDTPVQTIIDVVAQPLPKPTLTRFAVGFAANSDTIVSPDPFPAPPSPPPPEVMYGDEVLWGNPELVEINGVNYHKYTDVACSGRNEIASGKTADNRVSCEAKYCQSGNEATCQSFEFGNAKGKCQSGTSCTYAVSEETPGWDLYVYVPETTNLNGYDYKVWNSASCPGRNELGGRQKSNGVDINYCADNFCRGSSSSLAFKCNAFEIKGDEICQFSSTCFPGNFNDESTPAWDTYVWEGERVEFGNRIYRFYPSNCCKGRNEIAADDQNQLSLADYEAQYCQGTNSNCASFEYQGINDFAGASTTCDPNTGDVSDVIYCGKAGGLYVYIGEYE